MDKFGREYTNKEKKMLIAKHLMIRIRVAFKNHIYWYHGDLFKQLKGGAIGARLTGVVARVVMDKWEQRLREVLRSNLVKTYLLGKYVDDVNLATSIIGKGYR